MLNKELCRECNIRAGQGWYDSDEINWENQEVFCIQKVARVKARLKTGKIPDDCLFHLEQTLVSQD